MLLEKVPGLIVRDDPEYTLLYTAVLKGGVSFVRALFYGPYRYIALNRVSSKINSGVDFTAIDKFGRILLRALAGLLA